MPDTMIAVRCQHEGCNNDGMECFLPDYTNTNGTPDEWLCATHAREHGYCPGCGEFWAGVESFDFSPSGYCDNCKVEFEEPEDDEDEPSFEYADA